MSNNVRHSHVFVECHRACNGKDISDYYYEISFEGDLIMDGHQLTAADLRDMRDSIDAALKLTNQEKGGRHESD